MLGEPAKIQMHDYMASTLFRISKNLFIYFHFFFVTFHGLLTFSYLSIYVKVPEKNYTTKILHTRQANIASSKIDCLTYHNVKDKRKCSATLQKYKWMTSYNVKTLIILNIFLFISICSFHILQTFIF